MQFDFSVLEEFITQLRSGEMTIMRADETRRYREVPFHHSQHFLTTLEQMMGLVEAEVQKRDDRIEQLSSYVDRLIVKHHGPGTYKLGEELWSTEEPNHAEG